MTIDQNLAQVIPALQANLISQVNWLKSCQILAPGSMADGAIKRYPDQGWVTPYFSNFTAMALLEDPPSYPLVERYLDWYLRNLSYNGAILDYHYDKDLNFRTARPDSEDAYAGTYLSLAVKYLEKSRHTQWALKNLHALKKVARVIVNLMDRDGLTYALATYRVKYLMDNCEAYKGLIDFAGLLEALGDREATYYRSKAGAIADGIEKSLWNKKMGLYHPSKTGWFTSGINVNKFYPDATCQIFPVTYELIRPDSERGARLYQIFNNNQPDWINIQPPDYPWAILGYYACLHGDYRKAYEKVRMARQFYIDPGSGNWFCAEAAFFVLTCAKLIEKREQWFAG